MTHIPTASLAFPLKAELEWRRNYQAELSQDWWSGSISVRERHPWYSTFGIYSHYHIQVIDGATVRYILEICIKVQLIMELIALMSHS